MSTLDSVLSGLVDIGSAVVEIVADEVEHTDWNKVVEDTNNALKVAVNELSKEQNLSVLARLFLFNR
jgi:hypothetical protein